VYILAVLKVQVDFNLRWITFFFFYAGIPLLILIDTLLIIPLRNKRGESLVVSKRRFFIHDDVNSVFNVCLSVLDTMKYSRRIMKRPKSIQILHGDSVISIRVSKLTGGSKIDAKSDSKWISTKIDFRRANENNMNEFDKLIRERYKDIRSNL
jgi:hypothetical protein